MQGPSSQKCLVWGLAFLSDGTVVSVDSAGKVQFWDSATGTLLSKHPISKAAVLSVAVAEVGESCKMWPDLQTLIKRTKEAFLCVIRGLNIYPRSAVMQLSQASCQNPDSPSGLIVWSWGTSFPLT